MKAASRTKQGYEKALSRLRAILPTSLLNLRGAYVLSRERKRFGKLSPKEIFSTIYNERLWGSSTDSKHEFFSGSGSLDEEIVNPYLIAVGDFFRSLDFIPNVVDLGCGNFSVGSKIRPLCRNYIACDVVDRVVNWNREKYQDMKVEFKVLNIVDDELPQGDVVFLRQVLQHLSNHQIQCILLKIATKYKYLILTEHIPNSTMFISNIDKSTGQNIRLGIDSGIIVTDAPFSLPVLDEKCLCEVRKRGGIIRTNVYKLT